MSAAVADDFEQSIPFRTDEAVHQLAQFVGYDGIEDKELLTEKMNKLVYYHELPGVPNPSYDMQGRVLNADRVRGYAIPEVELLLALPSTQKLIAEFRKERVAEQQAQRKSARAAQLAEARRIKQAKGEASLVPMLYAKVVEQERVIDALLKTVASLQTGNASVVDAVGELSRPLPQVD